MSNLQHYTVKQTAELLSLSDSQVRNLIALGQLEVTDLGTGKQRRAARISAANIEKLIKQRALRAAPPKRRRRRPMRVVEDLLD